MRPLPLRNLSPGESLTYLDRRAVPDDQRAAVLDFTHGHPLALSLVADLLAQRPGIRFHPQAVPDMIKVLLEQLVQKVPGPAHRVALEACALVRLTSQPLLAEMTGVPDAHDLFDWLRGLSFVESGTAGLFPHDLAREALTADLRWRNPPWYAELHRRARTFYVTQLQASHREEHQRILFDLIFLHRENPAVGSFFQWQAGAVRPDIVRDEDRAALLEMVARTRRPRFGRDRRPLVRAAACGLARLSRWGEPARRSHGAGGVGTGRRRRPGNRLGRAPGDGLSRARMGRCGQANVQRCSASGWPTTHIRAFRRPKAWPSSWPSSITC